MSRTVAKTSGTGSVGAASAVLLAENLGRTEIIVVNTHATQTLDLVFATSAGTAPTAVAGSGVRVAAGATFRTAFRGAIAVIGSGVATTYTITEH